MATVADLSRGKLIAVDWGTSRLRARLLGDDGAAIAETASDQGIGTLSGRHEAVFDAAVAAWPDVPAILAGMVGSRQGWREAAYVPCPATIASLAAAMTQFETASGRSVSIVPGLKVVRGDGNVLRGEETQIIGALDGEPGFSGTCVLPGTHSKWATIAGGTITDFASFISGELFDLLARQSFLRHSVADPAAVHDIPALPGFRLGVERTTRDGIPFPAALFSVRVRYLLQDADPEDGLAYLSGLVVGGEIAAAAALAVLSRDTPIRIIAASGLARAYHSALAIAGYDSEVLDGDQMALAGLVHLARATGLLTEAA